MDADEAFAAADEVLEAVHLVSGQGPVAEVGNVFAAGVEDQHVVAAHGGTVGKNGRVLGDSYVVARRP